MPVIVEHIQAPVSEDQVDLTKIYNDAPDWLKGNATADEWLTSVLASENLHLYTARFNDRLLAATVISQSGNNWQLNWLNVRTVTRNRGVGQRLISEVRRMATEQQCSFTVKEMKDVSLPSFLCAVNND